MSTNDTQAARILLDPYVEWAKHEGVPIHGGFGLDLHKVETRPWARFGCNGAIVQLEGRGDFMAIFVLEIPPGGKSAPMRQLFEEAILVLSGSGSTKVTRSTGETHIFEWGPNSVFSPPLNSPHQFFNASGHEPARLAMACNLPAVMNLFRNESFIFANPGAFPEREGDIGHFNGGGDFVSVRAGKHMWETNFIPDANELQLKEWAARGGGASHIGLMLADSTLHAHIAEMPVGVYKKAHRHGPDVHVFCTSGEGYSLFWFEGDADFVRIDWTPGRVNAPADMMFHQHFNLSGGRTRYLAFGHGSLRYPFTTSMRRVYLGVDVNVRQGGNQIEYADQDPRIDALYTEELRKRGIESRMAPYLNKIG